MVFQNYRKSFDLKDIAKEDKEMPTLQGLDIGLGEMRL